MSLLFRKENNIGFIEFDMIDSKVNLLTSDVIQRLNAILEEIEKNPALRALLITSKKKDVFIAGADIREIEGITQPADGEIKSRAGQKILDRLEDLKVPVIAVIDGVALGGGCELALACHYRIGTFNEKLKIGCPEVNLGFVPGFGGTYRLPATVGLSQGIRMVSGGQIVSGKDALKFGLLDRLYPQVGLDAQVLKFVEEIEKSPRRGRRPPKKKGLTGFLEGNPLGQKVLFNESRKAVLKATKGFYPAPLKAVEVIQQTHSLDRAAAMDIEAKAFSELAVTEISKNLVKVFYLTEKYKKLQPSGTENIAPKKIEKCGVIGAGIMGGGIAQLLSYNGIWTRLKDINFDAVGKGFKAAAKIYDQAVKRRKLLPAEAKTRMARITGTLDYSGFDHADLIIEAVVENMDVKKKVFKELGQVTRPDAILCTNTSALSVTEMAQEVSDPSRVIGLHFFNPVHRMPLIEIIKTDKTSAVTLASILNLTKRLGKTPIVVKDSCGFLVNRILLGYINEAGRLLEEGADIEVVDQVMTDFGMPMGPFTLSDEVGLDVGIKVLHILEKSFGPRFKPVEIFEKVFKAGFLGKKTDKGFFLYKTKERIVNPSITAMREVKGGAGFDRERARQRMLYVMINEAARCLEEGIIDEPGAVDVGMIMGTGFPPFRGGLLRYADSVGTRAVVASLKQFKKELGADRFEPCEYLLSLSVNGKGFYSAA